MGLLFPPSGSASGGRYEASPGWREEVDRLVGSEGERSRSRVGEYEEMREGRSGSMSVLDSASPPPITGWAERLRVTDREEEGSARSWLTLCRLNGSGVLTLTIFLQQEVVQRCT